MRKNDRNLLFIFLSHLWSYYDKKKHAMFIQEQE